jgi:hypothetical protein
LDALKAKLEGLLREKLIVECDVELPPPGEANARNFYQILTTST